MPNDPLQWPSAAMGAPKEGRGFEPRRTSCTLRLKSEVLTQQMGIFERQPIIKFLASGFYTGYSPLAPGTAGSLMGALVYLLIQHLPNKASLGIVALISISGIWIAGEAEKLYGKKDCPCIVIDEIAGMLTTLVLLPQGIGFLLAGFISFRIFDILKPFPIGLAERRLRGGWGIMMDDILAGVYAGLLVRLVHWIISYSLL